MVSVIVDLTLGAFFDFDNQILNKETEGTPQRDASMHANFGFLTRGGVLLPRFYLHNVII